MASDKETHHVQVDRVARYIWRVEQRPERDWSSALDTYRELARRILVEPMGWSDIPIPEEEEPFADVIALLRQAVTDGYMPANQAAAAIEQLRIRVAVPGALVPDD